MMSDSLPLPTQVLCELPAWLSQLPDLERPRSNDAEKMRLAIELARENVVRGSGGPFGAAVFRGGESRPVAVGVNCVVAGHNSMLHAEMLALMLAEQAAGTHTLNRADLPSHELFASCAPCAMCLGGILWSGVRRLVIAADRADAMGIGFDEGPVFPESYRYLADRGIEIVRDVLADEAREVLQLYSTRGGPLYNGGDAARRVKVEE